ncbi:dienelactone hydrolase [Mycobacteroides abscessus subsp. massiliense]|nr:dienelactone hydrolase [Mycobacteroides abscessus subsp. massiliense]SKR42691.1 dienelactone hydrolase [Mycobacteroides abscessus subsp. massiliense]SKT40111.1 dienelactone hydrolase [Mycobacteroides abscessus subsp. massiliense]SKT62115.1 dienelactone hydrolase [Mycobacteroides abscessus subsp. massiliense]SLA00655.1 dienelactone hydrolase [Mycobacteroides abscessus subsp. massiliense]
MSCWCRMCTTAKAIGSHSIWRQRLVIQRNVAACSRRWERSPPDRIDADAGSFLDFLADQPEVTGQRVGLTGYCMGGRISLRVAATHASRVGAVASFHGGNLAKADDLNSPHHLAARITGVVLIAAAEEDASFPAEQEQLLRQVLTDAGVRHTIETYPAKHGFAVTDNPTYDEGAAQRHWKALEDLYGATLGR